ncbi:MAG: helix-turn-helix transcriptional regulator [Anaerolineae bacterium]|nr:helix-turn-helix transcriptional regulator [Anaerolineae bacterium]
MSDHHVQLLFQGDLIRVEDFRCQGTHAAHAGEECAADHEIVFPRRGLFVRRDASGSVVADANQALFFHRGQPYQISHPVPGGDRSTVFAVEPSVLLSIMSAYDPAAADKPEKPFPGGHSGVDSHQRLLQYHLLRRAFQGEKADPLQAEEEMLILLADVIRMAYHAAGRSPGRSKPETINAHRDLVEQVKIVLAAYYTERLRLQQIALAVSASPYFLCRVFKQVTGLSLHAYLTRLRLLHALEYLADRNCPDLTALAHQLGFSTHSQFSAAFRREFGLTPRQFRLKPDEVSKNQIV